MNLNDLLIDIDKYAKSRGIKVFIVGGAVRDSFLFPDNIPNDIDLTTGDKKIYTLAYELSKRYPGAEFQIFDGDGHTALIFENFRIDFSNNFVSDGVERLFRKQGIKKTPLRLEMFSRDFTMNALLMNLARDKIWDITKRGVQDIQKKIIRCPVSPMITFLDDPKRMLRAIKYSLKLGFTIGEKEQEVIKRHAKLISDLPAGYIKKIIADMLKENQEKTIEVLYNLRVLKHIPLTKEISRLLMENRQLIKFFE